LDPDLLARELAEEENLDPLDAFEPDQAVDDASPSIALACDQGLLALRGNHDQRLQGLQVFCEHRDPRALPLLLPLLQRPCPVERMSAVYALGRNPSPPAVEPLLQLLQVDSNAYVEKQRLGAWGIIPTRRS
jgi:HEAT repeat protein